MSWFLIGLGIISVCFGLVVFVGAPYLPTLTPQVTAALKLAALKPGQHLLELGCGDGKILVAAARQGIKVTGYELNPLLVLVCKIRTWRYRQLVTVRLADFWRIELPTADAVFVFLLPKYMTRLDTKLNQLSVKQNLSLRLISFAFQIPDRRADKVQDGIFVYDYQPTQK